MDGQRGVRVGYVIDSFDIGGTELNAVRTAESLDRSRYRLTVFHLSRDGPLKMRYEALGVDMIHLPIANLYSVATAAQGLRFSRLLRERNIDVIHSHDVYTNSFAAPWARLMTRCAVLASRRWTQEVPRPAFKIINRLACRFSHRILANSDSVADYLVKREKVRAAKVVVIRNFVGDAAFSTVDAEERSKRRDSWGIPPGAFAIGCVSRLVPVKNHAFLIRALSTLPPDFHLLLVGAGPSRADLEVLTAQLGLGGRVHFLGEVISAMNLNHFFDASVLVSRNEGFPNALVEALAAGRAVVATAVGGIPDLIKHEVTGLLVEQDDVSMLARHLLRIHREPTLAKRLGATGCEAVRRQFHQSAVIAQYCSLYDELAALAGRRLAAGGSP